MTPPPGCCEQSSNEHTSSLCKTWSPLRLRPGVLQLGHMGALVLLLEKPYIDLHSGYTGRYSYLQWVRAPLPYIFIFSHLKKMKLWKLKEKNYTTGNYPESKDKYRAFSLIGRSLLQFLHMHIYAGIRTQTLGKDPGHGGGQEGRGIKHMRYESGRDEYAGGRKIQHGGGRERYPVFEEIKQNKMCEMTQENRRLVQELKT